MKLSRKAIDARKKVLEMYPHAILHTYGCETIGTRFSILVPSNGKTNGLWLETNKESSPNKNKAWIDAYNFVMKEFLRMLHY